MSAAPRGPLVLVVIDGFGIAPRGPGQRGAPGAHARTSTRWRREGSAHPHRGLGAAGRASPTASRATARWATSTSARAAACRRCSCASTRRSRTARSPALPALQAALETGRAQHAAPDRAGRRRRRARQPAPRPRADPDRPGAGRRAHRGARLHRRARHPPRRRPRGRHRDRGDRRPRRHGLRPLLGDGPRPALGPHQARLRRDGPRRTASAAHQRAARRSRSPTTPGVTDEFIEPAVIGDARGEPDPPRRRAPLLATSAPTARASSRWPSASPDFDGFERGPTPVLPALTTMTRYKAEFHAPVLFEAQDVRQGLAETVSGAGRRQLHVAETEKYAHVTFFFNGGREEPFEGERRVLVPSPQHVAHLRPRPRDERGRGARRRRPGAGRGRRRADRRQLRQRRHGRTHRRGRGRRAGHRDGRRLHGRRSVRRSPRPAACSA